MIAHVHDQLTCRLVKIEHLLSRVLILEVLCILVVDHDLCVLVVLRYLHLDLLSVETNLYWVQR